MKSVLRWLGAKTSPVKSLSEEFTYIENMYCRLTLLELCSSNTDNHCVIIPPFLHKNAGEAPDPKAVEANLAVYWPIILHNSFSYGVCEISHEQYSLLRAFELTLRNLDNPWVAFLFNCGKEQVSFKIAISRQDDWTKNALSIARQHYDDSVEGHIKQVVDSFSLQQLQSQYHRLS